jgi:hypothetical protein
MLSVDKLNADIEAQPDPMLVSPGTPEVSFRPKGQRTFGLMPGIKKMVVACHALEIKEGAGTVGVRMTEEEGSWEIARRGESVNTHICNVRFHTSRAPDCQ